MLNILTIHAIRKTSSLPKPLKTLLLSIAVSDLGVGFLAQPLYIAWMVSCVTLKNILCYTINFHYTLVLYCCDHKCIQILGYSSLSQISGTSSATHKRVPAVVISIWTSSLLFPPLICYLNSKKTVNAVMIVFFFGSCGFIIMGIIFIPGCISLHAVIQTKFKSFKCK